MSQIICPCRPLVSTSSRASSPRKSVPNHVPRHVSIKSSNAGRNVSAVTAVLYQNVHRRTNLAHHETLTRWFKRKYPEASQVYLSISESKLKLDNCIYVKLISAKGGVIIRRSSGFGSLIRHQTVLPYAAVRTSLPWVARTSLAVFTAP
jgi:hypothetical protein